MTQVCERWTYSACLCFALDLAEQEKTGFHYDYSLYQAEYSRNLLFTRGGAMDQVFQGVIDRTSIRMDVKTLKTIFGTKTRPARRKAQKPPRLEVVIERPTYDLTVFKIHFGKISAKMYTKGERILHIEVILHNARALSCARSLPKSPHIVSQLKGILNRFLKVLRCIDISCIGDAKLEALPSSSLVGQTRVGGVDISKPSMRAVTEVVIGLAAAPQGFRSSDLAAKARAITGANESEYTAHKAAYHLKKLRGKNLVRKTGRSRRYQAVPKGLQAMTALLVLREKVIEIEPVLAGAGKPRRGRRPKNQCSIDAHYETMQLQMRNLFELIGIAV